MKLSFKKTILSFLLLIPILSFAGMSEQQKLYFNNTYGNQLDAKTAASVLSYCDEQNLNVEKCLKQLEAKEADKKSVQRNQTYRYCCLNVSNKIGEYAYLYGKEYCIPPC